MKNLTTRIMIAAAALAALAGAASAQSLRADVPFAFQIRGKAMPAGSYTVSMDQAKGMVEISDHGTRTTAMLMPTERIGGDRDSDPKLVFSCTAGNCTLVQAWSGIVGANYAFAGPRTPAGSALLIVRLHK